MTQHGNVFTHSPSLRNPLKRYSVLKVLLAVYHNIRYTVNMSKKKTSLYLSEEALSLLKQVAMHLGISQSAVLEMAIRVLAKREGIPPIPTPTRNGHSSAT